MAEGKKEKDPGTEDSVKLFVGQVPKHMAEAQLLDLFQEFARVEEVNVIRDKSARASRGCCFVTCPSREEADKAITAYHNKLTLPGASSPLQVKYANGELERLEHKLFIGMLPKNVSEEEVSDLFSTYGTIKDMHILKGSQQTSKAGCAFVKYETKEQAVEALNALNGKHNMEGSSVPLIVKWADTEKERQARRAQKALSQVANIPNTDPQNPSLFGALPMSYIPSYNGYGYQAPGSYRLMQYRIPPMQNHFQNMIPPVTHQRNNTLQGTSPEFRPRNYGMSPTSSMPNAQYPPMGAYHGGMLCQRLFSGSMASTAGDGNSALPTVASSPKGGGQIEGPPGANLFIYHIPQEYGDQELANAFRPFGQVLSAKVFVDKATGASKCFGFVSYDSSEDAQSAINNMNGHQLGGNKLKVQLKRDNRQNKPY